MSIQRRFFLYSVSVILLFAINLAVFLWKNHQQTQRMEELYRAVERRLLLNSIRQHLNDLHSQVAILSQVYTESTTEGSDTQQLLEFEYQLSTLRDEMQKLKNLTEEESAGKFDTFSMAYEKLASSWKIVYENLGVNNNKAITELSLHADPLNQMFIQKLLPTLEKEEEVRVETARSNFYQVAKVTAWITIPIFFLSVAVIVSLAYNTSRYILHPEKGLEKAE